MKIKMMKWIMMQFPSYYYEPIDEDNNTMDIHEGIEVNDEC